MQSQGLVQLGLYLAGLVNGWTLPIVMLGYLFALAYLAGCLTYNIALAMGGG